MVANHQDAEDQLQIIRQRTQDLRQCPKHSAAHQPAPDRAHSADDRIGSAKNGRENAVAVRIDDPETAAP